MKPPLAVTAEYDPLHRGHAKHLAWLKSRTDAPLLVILGGVFSQRGEGALLHPVRRTAMALALGADLVVALPAPFCCGQAGLFASGAMRIAHAMGAEGISFGAEQDDTALMRRVSLILVQESTAFKARLRDALNIGMPYAAARATAAEALCPGAKELLSAPNNALGVAYLTEAFRLGFEPEVHLLRRTDLGHRGGKSGTSCRLAWRAGESLYQLPLPPRSGTIALEALETGDYTPKAALPWPVIHHLITSAKEAGLEACGLFSEGLAPKAVRLAFELTGSTDGTERLIENLTSKRHPRSRLRRSLLHLYLGLSKDDILQWQERGPQAVLLLGASAKGRAWLKHHQSDMDLPLARRPFELARVHRQSFDLFWHCETLWESLTARPSTTRLKSRRPVMIP